MNSSCHACGTLVPADTVRQRSATCPACRRDLRVCLNCRFFSPGAHWDCAENIGEPVRDKDRANFCDWFAPRPPKEASGVTTKEDAARKAFGNLFGGGE